MRCVWLSVSIGLLACAGAPPGGPGRGSFVRTRWQSAVVRPGVSLRGLCLVDARVAWASGSRGTVLRTEDGGDHWQQVGPPATEALDFRCVRAFDARRALVLSCQPARVYATDDGGASWRIALEDPLPQAFFDAMAFFDDRRGLLFGDPVAGAARVFATDDGGASWRLLGPGVVPAPADGEAAFAASGTCVATRGESAWIVTGGRRCRALRTTDAGVSWTARPLPLLQGEPSQGAFSVAFFDARHGVVVGGDYAVPAVADGSAAVTADGGVSWTAVAGGALGYRSAVACLPDGRSCIAVGSAGAAVSCDRGASWQPFGDDGFHAVAVAGTLVVAVGSAGRIGRIVWSPP